MSELPRKLSVLVPMLDPPDTVEAGQAVEVIAKMKGVRATRALVDYLKVAPVGLYALRAALALETRKDPTSAAPLRELFVARPELADDIVPILSALIDTDAVPYVMEDLPRLLGGNARRGTLAFLLKCGRNDEVGTHLLRYLLIDPIPEAEPDLKWALEHILTSADERALSRIQESATLLGPEAVQYIAPYMPPKSELEVQAPLIARRVLAELVTGELVELRPDSEDALVDLIAETICNARSPKALVRSVERILMDSNAVEEFYGEAIQIREAFAKVTSGG